MKILVKADRLLRPIPVDLLAEITMPVKEADRDEIQIEIAGRFTMVARQNAETAGIIWNRFVKSKLGRKICDWPLDDGGCSGFAVGVLSPQIIDECFMNLFQFAQKSLVLSQLFQTSLARKLEHSHRIMIGPVPQIGIEMTKEAAGRGLPCPPKDESHLPQRFERGGKRRDYVINLKRRHRQ